jgi:hypothetical protein
MVEAANAGMLWATGLAALDEVTLSSTVGARVPRKSEVMESHFN